MPDQPTHWEKIRYRGPEHPVVQAYVLPKLKLIESKLCIQGNSIVDVGCGPGVFTHFLREHGANVIGVDASPVMVARNQGYPVIKADAARLPFPDKKFDIAFEANVLHHVADPQRVVGEMARVATEAVVLIEPNRLNPIMFGFSLLFKAERGGLRSGRRYLRQLLKAAGLRVAHQWTRGMISQNNTPTFLVPALRWFDFFDFPFGEYHVLIGKRDAYAA